MRTKQPINPVLLTVLAAVLTVGSACSGSDDRASASSGSARAATADQAGDEQTPTTASAVRMEYEQQPPTVAPPICAPATACVVPFSLLGASTGGFDGISVQAGAAGTMPDGSLYANSTLVFTGTVAGCGTGTVLMRSTGFNRNGETSGTVAVVAGSGTGELAGLTGRGTVVSGEAGSDGAGASGGVIEFQVDC